MRSQLAMHFLFIKDLKKMCSIGLFISHKHLAIVGTLAWLIYVKTL